jgi:hypothetical protein
MIGTVATVAVWSVRIALLKIDFCRVTQLVACLAHNQKVAGSSPAPATNMGEMDATLQG